MRTGRGPLARPRSVAQRSSPPQNPVLHSCAAWLRPTCPSGRPSPAPGRPGLPRPPAGAPGPATGRGARRWHQRGDRPAPAVPARSSKPPMAWLPDPPDPYGGLQDLWAAGAPPPEEDPPPELAALAARLELQAAQLGGANPAYFPHVASSLAHYDALTGPAADLGLGAGLGGGQFGTHGYSVPPQVRYAHPPRGPGAGGRGARGRGLAAPQGEVNYNKIITKKLASATQFHQVRTRGWRGGGGLGC